MKSYYNSRSSQRCHKAGDTVWLHVPQRKNGISPKLSRPWQGPYVVTKCINDLIYNIQLGPTTKPKIVHHDRLWKYHGEKLPTWFLAANMCPNPCKASQTLDATKDAEGYDTWPESGEQPKQLFRRGTRDHKPPRRFSPTDY